MIAPSPADWSTQPTVVFTGAFGSGKTEVAIAYALAVRAAGRSVGIVDLDIVTPYFRVGDCREQLQRAGLRVVAPEGGLASFETPALPAEIAGALADRSLHLVLDAGGDPEGARLLAVYAEQIEERGCDLWMVTNPFRPSTSAPSAVADQARAIEALATLRLTGLVANPNLGAATRPTDLERGLKQVQQAAERLRLPLVLLAAEKRLVEGRSFLGVPVLPLDLALRLPWQVQ